MPDYVKHISKTKTEAYCGAQLNMDWAFVDYDHAVQTMAHGDRFTVCKKCLAACEGKNE